MSIEFLQNLNGNNRGALDSRFDRFDHEPPGA